MKKRNILLPLLVVSTASIASAQVQSYDFNDTDTLTNDFSFDTNSDAAFSAGNGLTSGGTATGAIANSSSGDNRFTAVTNAGSVAFSTGSNFSLTQSIFFQTTSGVATAGNETPVVLGLTGNANEVDRGNAWGFADAFVHAGVKKNGTTNSFDYNVFTLSENRRFGSEQLSSGFTLDASTWYQFSVTYDYDSSGNTWTTTSSLDEANSDGSLVVSGNIVSFTSTAQVNNFTATDDIYGFFGSTRGIDAGVAYYDNAVLGAVPEPSSYALIAGFLGLGWVMLRRRK